MAIETFKRNITTPFALDNTPQVPGRGPMGKVSMAIFGEAPGETEVAKGEPFVGIAGEHLQWMMNTKGLRLYLPGMWKSNVIDRQPPQWDGKNNDISGPEAQEAIAAQREEFWREVEWLVQTKGVKVILAAGNIPTAAFGISGKITAVRGSVYELNLTLRRVLNDDERTNNSQPYDAIVIPMLHPSGLYRNRWTTKGGGGLNDTAATIEDMKKAKRIATEGYIRPIEDFELFPTADRIVEYLKDVTTKRLLTAGDIETDGDTDKGPDYSDLFVLSLSTKIGHAISIPWKGHGGLLQFTNGSRNRIDAALNELLSTVPLMFQSASFDATRLLYAGYHVDLRNVTHDTLLLDHAISSERPHNLGHITSLYGQTSYWKDVFKEKVSLADMSDEDARRYNCRDSNVLQENFPGLFEELSALGGGKALSIYRDETMALFPSFCRMHLTGMLLDKDRLREWAKYVTAKEEKAHVELRRIAGVEDNFSFSSSNDTQVLIFGLYPENKLRLAQNVLAVDRSEKVRIEQLAKVNEEIAILESKGKTTLKKYIDLIERRDRLNNKERTKEWFEAKETVEKYTVLKPIWPGMSKYKGKKGKSGKKSLSKETYPEILIFVTKRLETVQSLRNPDPVELSQLNTLIDLLTTYGEYSRIKHVRTTYTKYHVWKDGRVHTRFKQYGTATGRPASEAPNLLNIPKRELWAQQVRKVWVATPGCMYIAADYMNIEFIILAYFSGEQGFIDIVEKGLSIHNLNIPLLFPDKPDINSDDPDFKPRKGAAKIFQFGGVQYLGGDRTVWKNIVSAYPKLGLTFKQYQIAKEHYHGRYPIFSQWQAAMKEMGTKKRVAITPFGRYRQLLGNDRDLEKAAVNTPIQGGAAHIINRAQLRIEKVCIENGLMRKYDDWERWKQHREGVRDHVEPVLQIYDQLIYEVPIPMLEQFIPIMIEEMERPVTMTDWRGKDWTFTPPVDPSIGIDLYGETSIPFVGATEKNLRGNGTLDMDEVRRIIEVEKRKKVTFTDDVKEHDNDTLDDEDLEEDDE